MVLAGLSFVALGFGGCAQSPQQIAAASRHGREYFPSSVYGSASRRVVADGQPIPRGGGQYLVGKPYTIAGQTYVPSERRLVQVGNASWYGDAFHGRLTANGEIYDKNAFTAAHPTMPLPSYARVTNLRNNYSMIVRVNDRGPYASNRIMDVSGKVAEALDFKRMGTAKIKVEYVGRASLAGSDDVKLYATLRTNAPAPWQGEPTMVAEAPRPIARVASLEPVALPEPHRDRVVADEASPPRVREGRREDPREKFSELPHHQVLREAVVRKEVESNRSDRRIGRGEEQATRKTRLASLETYHLPIDQLLPPPRPSRSGFVPPSASSRHLARPPVRPAEFRAMDGGSGRMGQRRLAALRLVRARDE